MPKNLLEYHHLSHFHGCLYFIKFIIGSQLTVFELYLVLSPLQATHSCQNVGFYVPKMQKKAIYAIYVARFVTGSHFEM